MSQLDPRFIQLVSDELCHLETDLYRDRSKTLHKSSTTIHELHAQMVCFHKVLSRAFSSHVDFASMSYHRLACDVRALRLRINELSVVDIPIDLENDDW
jgi:hypothetical protein